MSKHIKSAVKAALTSMSRSIPSIKLKGPSIKSNGDKAMSVYHQKHILRTGEKLSKKERKRQNMTNGFLEGGTRRRRKGPCGTRRRQRGTR
jgi:hypothetical protein